MGRFKLGSDTPGLVRGPDGSITIPISARPQATEAAANWLPAPQGPFYLILRLYQPTKDVLSGRYELPQVARTR
ncbi:MAG: DUF1214 domain-containing protein [Acetobacteraceae bacterium]|nr:DUF1214 domain-containing protein [Acetobacteraceae bacterium]